MIGWTCCPLGLHGTSPIPTRIKFVGIRVFARKRSLRAAFEIIRNEVEAFRDGSATAEAVPAAPAAAAAANVVRIVDRPIEVDETQAASEVEAAASEPEMEVETAIVRDPAIELRGVLGHRRLGNRAVENMRTVRSDIDVSEEMPVHVKGFAGGDRTDIDLPDAQKQLLEALGATGKPLVVVLLNGSALAVNWAQQHAAAILEAWYPGEEGGAAIAETLSGKNNPAGRLPVTFYTSTEQLPPFEDYSMHNRTYRYFKGKPLYGFGYGLSYTRFSYSGLTFSSTNVTAGEPLEAHVTVRNDGKLAGDEVAELYLAAAGAHGNPALRGLSRVHLAPGESREVSFTLTPRDLSTVDQAGKRDVQPGKYTVMIGGAQPSEAEHVTGSFEVSGSQAMPE